MITPLHWSSFSDLQRQRLLYRRPHSSAAIERRVRRIVKAVQQQGDRALYRLTAKLDRVSIAQLPLRVEAQEIASAVKELSPELIQALGHAIRNVQVIHQQECQEFVASSHTVEPGIQVTHHYRPVPSVGLYIPRGRGSFPSMLIMLAVPALMAGVPHIAVATPPNADGRVDAACRYVAGRLGLSIIYRVGGAQALAALAYGTESIQRVDKIVGPGSTYVNSARFRLRRQIDSGMPAGPSEAILLADSQADPHITALDLLIEAEHGSDSTVLLLTPHPPLATQVAAELSQLLPQLPMPRRHFASDALSNGGIIITANLGESIDIINRFAPEHLKIDTVNPQAVAEQIQCAGEILIGPHSAFSLANYAVGANAVLPTGGTARSWSGIAVRDFLIRRAHIEIATEGYHRLKEDVITLADYEQFFAHALALRARN